MPSIGDEVAVTPTHVIYADRMFVQFSDQLERFEEFQYTTLKNVEKSQLKHIPSEKITFESVPILTQFICRCIYILASGELVLARYELDQCVYRARVKSFKNDHVEVSY